MHVRSLWAEVTLQKTFKDTQKADRKRKSAFVPITEQIYPAMKAK